MPITKEVHFLAPQAEKYLHINTLFHEKKVSTYPAVFFQSGSSRIYFLFDRGNNANKLSPSFTSWNRNNLAVKSPCNYIVWFSTGWLALISDISFVLVRKLNLMYFNLCGAAASRFRTSQKSTLWYMYDDIFGINTW